MKPPAQTRPPHRNFGLHPAAAALETEVGSVAMEDERATDCSWLVCVLAESVWSGAIVRGKTYHGDFSGIPSGKRILYVAYPLLTVSQESAGGAEQILWTLEREMTRRGTETTVAASAGSRVAGELFSTGKPCRELDDFERRRREHEDRIVELILRRERECRPFALIHDMTGC